MLFKIELPLGSQIVDVTPHGASFWTQTARLATKLPDGSDQIYFLKVFPTSCRSHMDGVPTGTSLICISFCVNFGMWDPSASNGHPSLNIGFHSDMIEELPEIEDFTSSAGWSAIKLSAILICNIACMRYCTSAILIELLINHRIIINPTIWLYTTPYFNWSYSIQYSVLRISS